GDRALEGELAADTLDPYIAVTPMECTNAPPDRAGAAADRELARAGEARVRLVQRGDELGNAAAVERAREDDRRAAIANAGAVERRERGAELGLRGRRGARPSRASPAHSDPTC